MVMVGDIPELYSVAVPIMLFSVAITAPLL